MAKKERNIILEVSKRKYHQPNWFWYGIYYLVGRTPLLGGKYHPKYQIDDKIGKGPAFIIWNHQSRRDHTFICRTAWPRRVNIVCEYNEFFRGHLHWVLKMNQILPKKPFCNNDLAGIRAMTSIIKQGGVVALSPEGNSSNFGNNQPIVPGTGKFLKHFGVPVYCCDIRGSYLTNNKISEEDRIGKVFVRQYLLFSKEDLANMSIEEIDDKINLTFKMDDYEFNKTARIKYKPKKNGSMTTNLEDMCYRCPKCHEEFKMVTSKNKIECKACGNGATMDEYYDFHPFNDECVIPESPLKWNLMERKQIIDDIRKDPNYSFSFKVKTGGLPKDHYLKGKSTSEPTGEGMVTIDHQGFHFRGHKLDGSEYNIDLDYKTLYTFNIPTDLTYFAIYVKEEYVEFNPEERVVVKALLLTEEMHRLHVNYFKNFPWFNYLYEDKKNNER